MKSLYKGIIILGCVFSSHGGFSQDVVLNANICDRSLNYSANGETPDSLSNNKSQVFKLNPKVDIPLAAVSAGWSIYAMTKVYNKGGSTEAQILSLNKNNINSFDRGSVTPYNSSIDKMSYIPFYAAIPLPLAFFLTGDEMRSDFLKLTFLYFETLSITGLAGYSAVYFVDRYRPYAYDPSTSMGERMGQNAKNSFYAGHVEVIATSTFFISEVYASYYPDSKIKWLFFGVSGVATAGMGYMRLKAGEHFPSDIILGGVAGGLSGILVPYFHRNNIFKNSNISLTPFSSGSINGLSMVYKFNK
jgi:membrane-associated phospholipid phosphatase